MTEQEEEYQVTVAPASPYAPNAFTCHMRDPRGVRVGITLQRESAAECLAHYNALVDILLEKGWSHAQERAVADQALADDQPKLCEIHHVPMKQFEKSGRTWWSHRTDDPRYTKGYCHGKEP